MASARTSGNGARRTAMTVARNGRHPPEWYGSPDVRRSAEPDRQQATRPHGFVHGDMLRAMRAFLVGESARTTVSCPTMDCTARTATAPYEVSMRRPIRSRNVERCVYRHHHQRPFHQPSMQERPACRVMSWTAQFFSAASGHAIGDGRAAAELGMEHHAGSHDPRPRADDQHTSLRNVHVDRQSAGRHGNHCGSGRLTPQPCIPCTASPWAPGVPGNTLGGAPILNDTSTLQCNWGGVITVRTRGR